MWLSSGMGTLQTGKLPLNQSVVWRVLALQQDAACAARMRQRVIDRGDASGSFRKARREGTSAHILFLQGALFAIVRVRDTLPTTDDTTPFVRAVVALVAHANERCWPHVRITDRAATIAFLA